jgi:hypothetical protein
MSATDKELLALAAKWRERARAFTREAHESTSGCRDPSPRRHGVLTEIRIG